MLTQEEQNFLFDLYKNALYLEDKYEIEESFKQIDDEKIREKRNRLLKEAEKNASKLAKKLIKKIKHNPIDKLTDILNSEDQGNFGKELLKEIQEELN